MKISKKNLTLLLFVPIFVFAFGSTRVRKIDQIENETGTDLILNPTNDVVTDSITGGKSASDNLVLKSTSDATKGSVIFNTLTSTTGMEYDETQDALSISGHYHTNTIAGASLESTLQIHSSGSSDLAEVFMERHSDTAAYGAHMIFSRSRGAEDSETVVQSGDLLSRIIAVGHDGADYGLASEIQMGVDNGAGAGDMPGFIKLFTSSDGSEAPTERLRIDSTGKTKITGNLEVVSTTEASIPNPVMTNAQMLAIASPQDGGTVYDSTNKAINFFNGTSWKAVGANPVTTQGDLIIGDASGEGVRLPIGATDQLLTSNGTTASWQDAPETGNPNKESTYNYITNGTFEADTSGWTAYCNTTPAVTPDDFGGTVGTKIAITRNTTSPILKESADLSITTDAANSQGCGVYYDFDIPAGDSALAEKLKWIMDYNASAANVDDGDFRMYLMSSSDNFVANFNLINPSDYDVPAGKFSEYFKSFQTHATDNDYRIILHVATSELNALSLNIDEVRFRKQAVSEGAVVTSWQPYTPTFTGFGTVSVQSFNYRRVGSDLEIRGTFTSGTSTATEARVSLPYSSLSTIDTIELAGKWNTNVNNTTFFSAGSILIEPSVSYITFGAETSTLNGVTKQNGSAFSASGNTFKLFAKIPIEGWQGTTKQSSDYSGRDIYVIAKGNDSTVATGAVTNVNWIEEEDTTSSFDGKIFTAPETRNCTAKGSAFFTTAINSTINLYRDIGAGFVNEKRMGQGSTNQQLHFSGDFKVNKGDKIAFRLDNTGTLSNNTAIHHLHIQCYANPQTLSEAPLVAASYETNDAVTNSFTSGSTTEYIYYEDKLHDTHNMCANMSIDGTCEVPLSGKYCGFASATTTANVTDTGLIAIYVQNDKSGSFADKSSDLRDILANSTSSSIGVPFCFDLNKGNKVRVRIYQTNGTRSVTTQADFNQFSIWRVK